jgi:hypothetical protein
MIELVSIHIPKTAGRTFLSILNAVYETENVAHFDRKNFPDKSIPETEQFKSHITEKVKVIHGHFRYKEIKDWEMIRKAKFIAWFRHPVERVISNYSFFKKRITLALDDPELQRRKHETLMKYASLNETRNAMSNFIEGLDIKDFFFTGIMEYYNDDVNKLAGMLNWKAFDIPRINDNDAFKSMLPVVTNHEKKLIAELNKEDIILYSKALEIRNKRIN